MLYLLHFHHLMWLRDENENIVARVKWISDFWQKINSRPLFQGCVFLFVDSLRMYMLQLFMQSSHIIVWMSAHVWCRFTERQYYTSNSLQTSCRQVAGYIHEPWHWLRWKGPAVDCQRGFKGCSGEYAPVMCSLELGRFGHRISATSELNWTSENRQCQCADV